uniref:Large ribosomal subunit protein uL3m n=1 Tax=Alona affinis TaxID=381656 RepID=A0A9N6WNZ0_9CRUS|nr:EOG090X07HN [Alona affinis]
MTTVGLLRCLVGSTRLGANNPLSLISITARNPTVAVGLFINIEQKREMSRVKRRKTHPPYWYPIKNLKAKDDQLTSENSMFIKEVTQEKFPEKSSPIKNDEFVPQEWHPKTRRSGLIARNIGVHQLWQKDGTRMLCTLLHVLDNHVIRYLPPEQYAKSTVGSKTYKCHTPTKGCLIVGAEATDPTKFTKQYCNLFKDVGLMPKKRLTKFLVSPNAALPPGTPLTAGHFMAGQVVDIFGKSISHGFQGVMKRWGFAGGPASHGCTKFHRRPGSIGHGRDKARVMPGKKLPGHMGGERRYARGLTIMRINLKYNVIYVKGCVPGGTNSIVNILETTLPLRKLKERPPHPTYYPPEDGTIPEEAYESSVHVFGTPSIAIA